MKDGTTSQNSEFPVFGGKSGEPLMCSVRTGCFVWALDRMCSHAANDRAEIKPLSPAEAATTPLEVTAGTDAPDKIKVVVDGPSCNEHPLIEVTSADFNGAVRGNEIEFEARAVDSPGKAGFFKDFFYPSAEPNSYLVAIQSCEGFTRCRVDAYSESQYKFEFKRRSKAKFAHKREAGKREAESELYIDGTKISTSDGIEDDDRSKFSVSFTRDGSDLANQLNLRSIASHMQSLHDLLEELGNATNKPKIQMGAGYEFEIEVFAGSVAANWGFKESPGYAVNFCYGVEFDLVLLSGSLEFNYGIEITWRGIGLAAKVFIKFSGTISIKGTYEKTPSGESEGLVPITGKPDVAAGLKGKVLHEKILNMKAAVKTGFTFTGGGGFDAKGLLMKYEVRWEGLLGDVQVVALDGVIETTFKHEFFKPQDIVKGRWPGEE